MDDYPGRLSIKWTVDGRLSINWMIIQDDYHRWTIIQDDYPLSVKLFCLFLLKTKTVLTLIVEKTFNIRHRHLLKQKEELR